MEFSSNTDLQIAVRVKGQLDELSIESLAMNFKS